MVLWNELRLLHETLPYPFLKLCGSSKKLAYLVRYMAYGGKEYEQWCSLWNDMQEWDIDKIYTFQFEMLKKLLIRTFNNVPYYKNIFNCEGLKPSDIKCLEDLKKLPVITKDDILKEPNKFFAKNRWHKRKICRITSGTSGKVLKVYQDKETIAASCATVNQICQDFLGYSFGKKTVLYSTPSAGRLNIFFRKRRFFLNKDRLYFYSPIVNGVIFPQDFNCDNNIFKEYVLAIKKFNIKHAIGSPSTFFAFAKYLRTKNIEIEMENILLFGEMLHEFQKKFIEKSLDCKIFNEYGQTEATIVACECSKHNGMHISPILGVAEILNRGLEGKGELVMTNLVNYSWPLIRYNIKDNVSLSKKKCSCGCAFPRLMSIEGRNNDYIMLPNGEVLHPMPFARLIKFIPNVKDIYFLQDNDYNIKVLVVKEEKSDPDRIKKALEKEVKVLSKNQLKIEIIFKEQIERKNSKYKIVESKIVYN